MCLKLLEEYIWNGVKGGDFMKFIKYVILCLRLAFHEKEGNISKEEADEICLNYLYDL